MPLVSARPSNIRDNRTRGNVADFLREKIAPDSLLSFVTAYFTIYGYAALRDELEQVERLRLLFGEPRFIREVDPDKSAGKQFLIDSSGLRIANQLSQRAIARECAEWIRRKVDIRSITQAGFLHGKLYHVAKNGVEHALAGSSNFTSRGLGVGADANIELNLEVDSRRDIQDLKAWFDELWNNEALAKDVKGEVVAYLEAVYRDYAPEFVYYKTLYHVFEKFLSEQDKGGLLDENLKIVDTLIWNALFEFQRDGVKGAINKILKHNGCILADSVGLGKTFEALAVIKYFELKNERVLVLCPKKLRENWTVYRHNDALNPFIRDRFRFDVLSHTDLSRETGKSGDIDLSTFNWGNFDLVVIDESHNFRNNTPGKRDDVTGEIVRRSRYQRLMEDIIQNGVKTKVLLLSATPVNNDLKDLRNQIYFLTEGDDTALRDSIGIPSLKDALTSAQKTFAAWARKQTKERRTADLLEKLSSAFFKLLDELTIARSRKHVQRYYKDSIAALGGFPNRDKPESIYPAIDTQRRFLSYDRLNDEISGYKLSLFAPSRYLKESAKPGYETHAGDPFSQADREKFLVGMMKVGFLKRLESSVHSFAITMERTITKIENLEKKIRNFIANPDQNPELDELEFDLGEPDEEELEASRLVGGKFKYRLEDLELDSGKNWLKDLQKDKQQLSLLYASAKDVTADRDAKLQELKKLIQTKVRNPSTNKRSEPNKKALVFTAFADTASYLFKEIVSWASKDLGIHVALVTGGGNNHTTLGKTDFNQILTNFSPRSKNRNKIPSMPQSEEIDLLIATDCISEGQNLQDCDYLINYDIHWNPVRIIQRFGRIDRIGSVNDVVKLVNFWPTQDLDKYVNLKNRVEARMALVDIAATFEDNILNSDELEELVHSDLKYRDKQLLRLREEILDLEDFNETVALNEFTLDDFRIELSKYIESNRAALRDAPLGLYAVVPATADHSVIAPGVIFCLRQLVQGESTESVNPLQPYYLVYVREDKVVRFGFAQPKQILEMYRLLCAEKTTAHDALCQIFDAETNNGADMDKYNGLLEAAVQSIARTFQRRAASGLQARRDFVLPAEKEQARGTADFLLVSWLVVLQSK